MRALCRGMGHSTATLLTTATVLVTAPMSVAVAQTIDGTLLDLSTDEPISFGLVLMFTETGDSVGLAVADEDGRFRLSSPEPGSFHLLATALGYRETPAGVFELGEDAVMSVEYRLAPEPFAIDEIVVTLDRPVSAHRLVRNGFVRRFQRGLGHFVTPHDIERSSARNTEELLTHVPNVRVAEVRIAREVANGEWTIYPRPDIGETVQISSPGGGWCTPTLYVDGVRSFYNTDMTSYAQAVTLSTMAPLSTVEAIEVYRRPAEIPVEYSAGSTGERCGVLVVWTKSELAAGQRPSSGQAPDLADVEDGRLPSVGSEGPPPSSGEGIRFEMSADGEARPGISSPWAGTFVDLRDGTLIATDGTTGRTVAVPVDAITALQVRRPQAPARAYVRGAVVGTAAGVGTWFGLGLLCDWSQCNSAIEKPWIPAAATGLLVGWMVHSQGPGDHWVRAVVPEISPTPEGLEVAIRLNGRASIR